MVLFVEEPEAIGYKVGDGRPRDTDMSTTSTAGPNTARSTAPPKGE